jgi:hypothetical protein
MARTLGRTRMGRPCVRSARIRRPRILCARVRPARVRRSALRHRSVRSTVRIPRMRPVIWVPAMRSSRTRPWPASPWRSACTHSAASPRRPASTHRPTCNGRRGVRSAPAVRHWPMRRRAGRRTIARRSRERRALRGRAGREPARRNRVRPPRLAVLRPGRSLARTPGQLAVVVFYLDRTARPGRIILLARRWIAVFGGVGSLAVAVATPLAPGWTIRVAAEAGVATFHQIPPGPCCPAAPRDICPYLLSVGRQKSPV